MKREIKESVDCFMKTSWSVSLVIPVRNEERSLPSLIESIKQQTFEPAEIIIVDGGSVDGTVRVAKEIAGRDPRFRVIEAGPATPGRGRNIGVAAARYDWIAFTDAGIRLEPDWLAELVRTADADPSLDVIYGNYEPVITSFFERCAALAYVPPKLPRGNGSLRGPSIVSCLMKRDAWARVGGFPDLRAAEDLIFMERIEKAGLRIGWAPQATVWWSLQPSFKKTFKKFALYSYHNVLADRQKYWHYGVARQYLVAIPFLLLGILHSTWWFGVPVAGFILRVARSIWRHRDGKGVMWLFNPLQFALVGTIILAIDLATFVGWGQAMKQSSTFTSKRETKENA